MHKFQRLFFNHLFRMQRRDKYHTVFLTSKSFFSVIFCLFVLTYVKL